MYLLSKKNTWGKRIKAEILGAANAEAFETLNVVWSCRGKRRGSGPLGCLVGHDGPLGCRWDQAVLVLAEILQCACTVGTQKIELDFTVGCLWTDFSVQAVREFSEGIIAACIMLNSPSITGANQYITNPT